MTRSETAPLSPNEEITLRRVAYGQSDVACLRGADLTRLRDLRLIEGRARSPVLTAEGKRRFDALAKPMAVTAFDAQNRLMDTLGKLMARAPRR